VGALPGGDRRDVPGAGGDVEDVLPGRDGTRVDQREGNRQKPLA